MTECLPRSLRFFFSNYVDVKVTVNPLVDDFRNDNIVLLLFPSLSSCDGVSSGFIYYIPDLFLLEYRLGKADPLRQVFKAVELLSLACVVVILVSHLADLNDLEESKNVILALLYISDLIT